jgi:hypothetical protein
MLLSKNGLRSVVIGVWVAVISGCGGSGSGSGSIEAGIEAGFTAMPSRSARNASAPVAEETQTFYTDEGRRIDLENGFISLSVVRLTRCSATVAGLGWGILHALLPAAMAHGNHVEAPSGVIDVVAADGTPFDLGSLPIEPGTYCGVELELTRLPAGTPNTQPDAIAYVAPCDYPDSATLPFVPGLPVQPDEFRHECYQISVPGNGALIRLALPEPLALNSMRRSATMTIQIEYDTWFDGVDIPALAQGDTAARQQLLNNMVGSMRLRP